MGHPAPTSTWKTVRVLGHNLVPKDSTIRCNITETPGEMDLMRSLFDHKVVELTIITPRFRPARLNVCIRILATSHPQWEFMAYVVRLERDQAGWLQVRECPIELTLNGTMDVHGQPHGWVWLPEAAEEALGRYLAANVLVRESNKPIFLQR